MRVIKGEFYCANEYNATSEYKHFPAEIYKISKEIGDAGTETADSGAEVTTLQKNDKKKPAKKSGDNNLVNKIFNSLKGVATVSTVAAVAVLGASTIATPPKVELLHFSVGGDYVEYQISVEELQDDLRYCIVVSTSNEADKEFAVEEGGVYENKVDGLKPKWEYSLAFVGYDEYLGKTTYFEKTFQTTTVITQEPEMAVSNVTLSGLNEIRVDFWHAELDETCVAELHVDCGEGFEQVIVPITNRELALGYVTVPVAENAVSVLVKPVIRYGENEKTLEGMSYEHAFDNSLDADVSVNLKNASVTLYLKGISGGATHVNVMDAQTGQEITKQELYENYITFNYEEGDALQYKVFLSDEAGNVTTGAFETTVNTVQQDVGEYVFNYKNPGAVGVTYNEDGTINVYIPTDFEAVDERLYYQVTLGNRRFQSREPIFVAEGLPNESYGLTYELCYNENGIQYSIYYVSVSGVVNEYASEPLTGATVADNSVNLSIYEYHAETIDLNSIRLVSSAGEEILVTETDFVYNEEYGEYTCTISFENDFEFVELYERRSPFGANMEGIDGYIGSVWVDTSMTIYKE